MDELKTPSKIDLLHAEKRVVFSISNCSLDKKYSFWKLNREQAKKFLSRLQYFERFTWKQLAALQRKNGLTTEKPDSDSFAMIDEQNTSGQIVEKYYFHLRIEQDRLFRIFGYQRGQFFSITHIDYNGRMHHS